MPCLSRAELKLLTKFIKFAFGTAVARRLKPKLDSVVLPDDGKHGFKQRAIAVPNYKITK